MEATPSLEREADRQISLLRQSTMRVILTAVSAPQWPASVLNAAVCLAANSSDLVGNLGDGSVGVISVQPQRVFDREDAERRFIDRLRARLLLVGGDRPTGRLWLRTVESWASELSAAADLLDMLQDTPPVSVVVGVPVRPFFVTRHNLRVVGGRSATAWPSQSGIPAVAKMH